MQQQAAAAGRHYLEGQSPGGKDRNLLASGKLSEVLLELGSDANRESISLGELLHILKDRAVAALVFIIALPNVVPTPPGTSAILGVPLVILSAQLMLGLGPWLPRFFANRSLSIATFRAVVEKAAPWLSKAERLMKPRLIALSAAPAQRLIGAICLLLAVILMLPIPLGNMLPALAICLLALGVLEHDGAWILLGFVAGAIAIGVLSGALYGAIKAFAFLFVAL
jgi:hypothetical protein